MWKTYIKDLLTVIHEAYFSSVFTRTIFPHRTNTFDNAIFICRWKCCYAPRVCNGKYVFTYGCIFLFILLTPIIFSLTNQTKLAFWQLDLMLNFLSSVQINIPSRQVLLKPGTYILSVYKKLVYRSLLKLVKWF